MMKSQPNEAHPKPRETAASVFKDLLGRCFQKLNLELVSWKTIMVAFEHANGDCLAYYEFDRSSAETSVSEELICTFGVTFEKATLDQKLALIESVSFLMRERTSSLENAVTAIIPMVRMPEELKACNAGLTDFSEGLALLQLLYAAAATDISRLVRVKEQEVNLAVMQ